MDRTKKVLGILIAAIVIVGLFGYWFYASKKDGAPSVNKNFEQKSVDNASTSSLIPNIFPNGKATLSWSPNKEVDLAGYKIYYGITPRTDNCPPGGYPQKVDIGNKTSYTIEKLETGKDYYFSITSYDKSGNESCFSAEVKKIIQK